MKKKIQYADFLEKAIGEKLMQKNIKFSHESQGINIGLDFYLYDYDIYIEIKQYHSDRIALQLSRQENVIVLQGKKSVAYFLKLLDKL
jgi:hypothetical protein